MSKRGLQLWATWPDAKPATTKQTCTKNVTLHAKTARCMYNTYTMLRVSDTSYSFPCNKIQLLHKFREICTNITLKYQDKNGDKPQLLNRKSQPRYVCACAQIKNINCCNGHRLCTVKSENLSSRIG